MTYEEIDASEIQTLKDAISNLSVCVLSLRHFVRQYEIATGVIKRPTCSYCGENVVYARGLCRNCYGRLLHRGTPEYANRTTNKAKEAAAAKKEEKRKKLLNWQLEIAKKVVPDLTPYPDLAETVEYVLENLLTERECKVLTSRYKDGKSLREISGEFGVTKERIRQVEAKAFQKLRHPSRKGYIQKGRETFERERGEREELAKEAVIDVAPISNAVEPPQNGIRIEAWGVSARAMHGLMRASFKTVSDVLAYLKEGNSLLKIRNIGAKTEREIFAKLKTDYGNGDVI